jgi:hypothetical protein
MVAVALTPFLPTIDSEHLGDEAMTMTKLLSVSILALFLMGFCGAPMQAQNAMPGPGMDMKSMKAQMEQMSAQMEQIQALMKDTMTKMAAGRHEKPHGNGTGQHEEPDGTAAGDR